MNSLDTPLDDRIKNTGAGQKKRKRNDNHGNGGRKQQNGAGRPGPQRRERSRTARSQAAPYQIVEKKIGGGLTHGPQILVSHLDSEVNDDDVLDIFQNVGAIKSAHVHYDRDGRSYGTAAVVFHNKHHALKAVEEYDGAEVDRRPMYVRLIASSKPVVIQKTKVQQAPVQQRGAKGGKGQQRGAKGGKGKAPAKAKGGRKGGKGEKKPASAEDLDADLAGYFQKSEPAAEATTATAAAEKPAAAPASTGQPGE